MSLFSTRGQWRMEELTVGWEVLHCILMLIPLTTTPLLFWRCVLYFHHKVECIPPQAFPLASQVFSSFGSTWWMSIIGFHRSSFWPGTNLPWFVPILPWAAFSLSHTQIQTPYGLICPMLCIDMSNRNNWRFIELTVEQMPIGLVCSTVPNLLLTTAQLWENCIYFKLRIKKSDTQFPCPRNCDVTAENSV